MQAMQVPGPNSTNEQRVLLSAIGPGDNKQISFVCFVPGVHPLSNLGLPLAPTPLQNMYCGTYFTLTTKSMQHSSHVTKLWPVLAIRMKACYVYSRVGWKKEGALLKFLLFYLIEKHCTNNNILF